MKSVAKIYQVVEFLSSLEHGLDGVVQDDLRLVQLVLHFHHWIGLSRILLRETKIFQYKVKRPLAYNIFRSPLALWNVITQNKPLNNDHYFDVQWLVAVHWFDCMCKILTFICKKVQLYQNL